MPRTRTAVVGVAVVTLVASGWLAADRGVVPVERDAALGSGRVVAGGDVLANLVAKRSQSVSAELLPPIAQPGPQPAPITAAKSVINVQVKPDIGGAVLLQRRSGKTWVDVETAKTGKGGRAAFAARSIRGEEFQTYRVLAVPFRGFAGAASEELSTEVWDTGGFLDEFDGDALDPNKWITRIQGYLPDSHRKCSRPDPSAVTVVGGTARLQVLADPARSAERCTRDKDGEQFAYRLNANVGTEGKYTFQYGYAAARVKFQQLRGQHGAFWLQGGKEIDIAEYFGDSLPLPLTSWVYDYGTGTKVGASGASDGRIRKPERFGQDWSGKFHVFSVEWTPERYIFRIDGTEVWRTEDLVSHMPQFVVMSLLSSDYYLEHIDEAELPQTMFVDWVRVWER